MCGSDVGKPFTIPDCWCKWSDNANFVKTANSEGDEVGDTSGGVGGGLAPAMRQERMLARMMDKWEDIMAKEEASAKHNELNDEKKAEKFNTFMDMQNRRWTSRRRSLRLNKRARIPRSCMRMSITWILMWRTCDSGMTRTEYEYFG